MTKLALCADAESVRQPNIIGLDGENLEGLSWLAVYSSAFEARSVLAQNEAVEEAWVVSSDEMDAINLAAALKADRPTLRVFLVASQASGSSLSRAQAAGIDGALSPRAFALRYAQEKRKHATQVIKARPKVPALMPDDVCEEDFLPSAATPPASQGEAFSLCVIGAGGGVGATATSLLAAHALAGRGLSVLLVDADLRLGSLGGVAEAQNLLSLSEAIDKPESIEALPLAGKVSCIVAPERLELADRLGEELPALVDRASSCFDVVVVDAGGSFSSMHMSLAERCTQTLILVGQRSSSVRACKRIVDVFARCGAATSSLVFAVNACSKGSLFSSIDASCLLQGSRVHELRDGGRIVEELVGVGAASSLLGEGNAFAVSVEKLMQEIFPAQLMKESGFVKHSPIKKLGEGLRARKSLRDQRRGDDRGYDAA